MAHVEGMRRTDDIAAFRVHYDLHKEIIELEPDENPLTVFSKSIFNGGRRKPTKTHKFRWPEYELDERFDAVDNGAGYTSGDGTIAVDTPDTFYDEALVLVPRTGEIMRVSDVGASDIDVDRGYGDSTAAALVDDEPLFVIGNAREEGDVSADARTRDPTEVYNYTQIWKRWVEESGTRHSSDDDTSPHDWIFQQKEQMIEHAKDIELSLLFGYRGEEDGTSGKVRTTAGALSRATENNVDAGGTLTETEWENWLRPFLRYGNTRSKVVFISPLVASVLNNFSQTKLQTDVGDRVYGVQVMRWINFHGEVKLVKHNLFEGDQYSGLALGIDFDKGRVAYRYLDGKQAPGSSRDTHMKENVQENDRDGRKDQVLTEAGLQMALPKVHGVLTGVTG